MLAVGSVVVLCVLFEFTHIEGLDNSPVRRQSSTVAVLSSAESGEHVAGIDFVGESESESDEQSWNNIDRSDREQYNRTQMARALKPRFGVMTYPLFDPLLSDSEADFAPKFKPLLPGQSICPEGRLVQFTTMITALSVFGASAVLLMSWVYWKNVYEHPGPDQPLEGSAVTASSASASERMFVIDNAKFFFMWSIIFIHLSNSISQAFFNPFATAGFCFMSGIVSRRPPSADQIRGLFIRVGMPLLFAILIVAPVNDYLSMSKPSTAREYGSEILWHLHYPCVEWFLFALIGWRCIGFAFWPLPPAAQLMVAVIVGAVGGYSNQPWFALSLMMTRLPLFVLGQMFPLRRALDAVQWSPFTFAIGCGLLWCLYYPTPLDWWELQEQHQEPLKPVGDFLDNIPMYGWSDRCDMPSSTSSDGHGGTWYCYGVGLTPRSLVLKPIMGYCSILEFYLFWTRGLFRNMFELAKILVFIVLCCPRGEHFITKLGSRSLYVYVLHYPFVTLFNTHTPEHFASFACGTIKGAALTSLIMNVFLASWPVQQLFGVFIEPTWMNNYLKCGNVDNTAAANAPETREAGDLRAEQPEASAQQQENHPEQATSQEDALQQTVDSPKEEALRQHENLEQSVSTRSPSVASVARSD